MRKIILLVFFTIICLIGNAQYYVKVTVQKPADCADRNDGSYQISIAGKFIEGSFSSFGRVEKTFLVNKVPTSASISAGCIYDTGNVLSFSKKDCTYKFEGDESHGYEGGDKSKEKDIQIGFVKITPKLNFKIDNRILCYQEDQLYIESQLPSIAYSDCMYNVGATVYVRATCEGRQVNVGSYTARRGNNIQISYDQIQSKFGSKNILNKQLSIEVGYSTSEGVKYDAPMYGIIFTSPPDFTVQYLPPTCHNSDNARIKISNLPTNTMENILLNVELRQGSNVISEEQEIVSGQQECEFYLKNILKKNKTQALPDGVYKAVVMMKVNGKMESLCPKEVSFTVSNPLPIQVSNLKYDIYKGVDNVDYYSNKFDRKPKVFIDISGRSDHNYELSSPTGGVLTFVSEDNYKLSNLNTGINLLKVKYGECESNEVMTTSLHVPSKLAVSCSVKESIKCHGETGKISFSITGGIGNFIVKLFKEGSNTAVNTISNLKSRGSYFTTISAGKYYVTVDDMATLENENVESLSVDLEQPAKLNLQYEKKDEVTCYGKNDGMIRLRASGGTPNNGNYQFTIGGSTGKERSDLLAGSYVCKVTDANNCSDTKNYHLSQPSELEVTYEVQKKLSCDQASNGKVKLSLSGGWDADRQLKEYTLFHSGGSRKGTSLEISNLNNQTYSIVVENSAGCKTNTNKKKEITVPSLGSDEQFRIKKFFSEPASCIMVENGEISFELMNGAADYHYKLDGEENAHLLSDEKILGLKAGKYSIEVIDANGCSDIVKPSIDIVANTLKIDELIKIDPSCHGASNGSLLIRSEGGHDKEKKETKSYELYVNEEWEQTNSTGFFTIMNLESKEYEITIKDDIGCTVKSKPNLTVDTQPVSFKLNAEAERCDLANNGEIIISDVKQSPRTNLTYSLFKEEKGGKKELEDKIADFDAISNTHTYSNLNQGTYYVEIKDNNNCTTTEPVEVGNKNCLPSVECQILEKLSCKKANNGRLLLEVNSLCSDKLHSYMKDESGNQLGNTQQLLFENLNKQTYTYVVQDEVNCESEKTISIPVRKDSVQLLPLEVTRASCKRAANGKIVAKVNGGKAPYTYSFNGQTISGNSAAFTSQAVGTKGELKVTDADHCFDQEEVSIQVQTDTLQFDIPEKTDPSCFNVNNGEIRPLVLHTKDELSYTYFLDKKDNTGVYQQIKTQNHKDFSDLLHGIYSLRVRAADGCEAEYQGIELVNPEKADFDELIYNYIKKKGEKTGEVSFRFKGKNKEFTYELYLIDEHGNKLNSEVNRKGRMNGSPAYVTNTDLKGLPAGSYRFILKDEKDACLDFEGSHTYSKEFTIAEPEFHLSYNNEKLRITDASCKTYSDGSILIEGFGGWGEYTYSMNGKTNTTGLFEHLSAGNYTLIIADKEGTTYSYNFTINEPDELILNLTSVKDATCPAYANGRVLAQAENGIYFNEDEDLQYRIENTKDRSIVLGESYQGKDYVFKQLPKGDYELFVTDSHACVDQVNFSISEPEPATIEVKNNFIKVKGEATGEINLTLSKGNGLFDWRCFKDGASTVFEEGQTKSKIELSDLLAGHYTIQIRDTAACIYEGDDEWMNREVNMREPEEALRFEVAQNVDVTCRSFADGRVELKPIGGWGDYRFTKNGGEKVSSNTFNNLTAGTYLFEVSDSVDTKWSQAVVVVEPEELKASYISHKDVNCFGGNDGEIELKIEGGNGAYQHSVDSKNWMYGKTVQQLKKGVYDIYIKDQKACEAQVNKIEIKEPDEIVLVSAEISESICLKNVGSIHTKFTGGVGEYTYSWQKGIMIDDEREWVDLPHKTTASIDELYAAIYIVKVKDEHDCILETDFTLGDISDLTVDNMIVKDVSCWSYQDGEVVAEVSKGNPKYFYFWDKDIENYDLNSAWNMYAGKYNLLVYDSMGCTVSKEFTIGTPEDINYQINEILHPLCLGGKKGEIDIQAKGGTPDYKYEWNTGDHKGHISKLDPGTYTVEITDSHDCKKSFDFEMEYQRVLHPFIGEDTLICHYNQLPIDGGDYAKHFWTSNNGFSSRKQQVSLTKEGDYYLKVQDKDQCTAFDTLHLDVSYLKINEINSKDVSCKGDQDAFAEITVSPSDWPYQVQWNNGVTTNRNASLSGGTYQVKVTDSYACFDKKEVFVHEPEELQLEVENLFHPLCHGVPDGVIKIKASGGNEDYEYTWEHGSDRRRLSGLDTGFYSVTLTDRKKCSVQKDFTLSYQKSIYPDLGEDIIVCSDNFVCLTPGDFEEYRWVNRGENIGYENELVVWEEGKYAVEVKNEEGCTASDTLSLQVQQSSLQPVLLSASSVAVGDTLMILEVSQPKPELVNWEFTGKYTITDEGPFFCKVIFHESGMFEMGLNAWKEGCKAQKRESIMVTPKVDGQDVDSDGEPQIMQIQTVKIHPNPATDHFQVEVELNEIAELNLYLVHVESGQIIEKRSLSGLKKYNENYTGLKAGMYCVYAESLSERLVRKIIVL